MTLTITGTDIFVLSPSHMPNPEHSSHTGHTGHTGEEVIGTSRAPHSSSSKKISAGEKASKYLIQTQCDRIRLQSQVALRADWKISDCPSFGDKLLMAVAYCDSKVERLREQGLLQIRRLCDPFFPTDRDHDDDDDDDDDGNQQGRQRRRRPISSFHFHKLFQVSNVLEVCIRLLGNGSSSGSGAGRAYLESEAADFLSGVPVIHLSPFFHTLVPAALDTIRRTGSATCLRDCLFLMCHIASSTQENWQMILRTDVCQLMSQRLVHFRWVNQTLRSIKNVKKEEEDDPEAAHDCVISPTNIYWCYGTFFRCPENNNKDGDTDDGKEPLYDKLATMFPFLSLMARDIFSEKNGDLLTGLRRFLRFARSVMHSRPMCDYLMRHSILWLPQMCLLYATQEYDAFKGLCYMIRNCKQFYTPACVPFLQRIHVLDAVLWPILTGDVDITKTTDTPKHIWILDTMAALRDYGTCTWETRNRLCTPKVFQFLASGASQSEPSAVSFRLQCLVLLDRLLRYGADPRKVQMLHRDDYQDFQREVYDAHFHAVIMGQCGFLALFCEQILKHTDWKPQDRHRHRQRQRKDDDNDDDDDDDDDDHEDVIYNVLYIAMFLSTGAPGKHTLIEIMRPHMITALHLYAKDRNQPLPLPDKEKEQKGKKQQEVIEEEKGQREKSRHHRLFVQLYHIFIPKSRPMLVARRTLLPAPAAAPAAAPAPIATSA